MPLDGKPHWTRLAILLFLVLQPLGAVMAQEGEASSSPAGLAMLMLFLGIAGILGVFVVRWSQSTGEDEE